MRTDLDKEVARLAERQYGRFSVAQARALRVPRGVRQRRLAAGRWEESHPGVYEISGSPNSYQARLMGAVLTEPDGLASHRAAARLQEVPGFGRAEIEIATPHPARREQRSVGFIRHYSTLIPDTHRRTLHNIPTTTVARTLFDLCAVVHPGRAERAVDNCLSRKWVTMPALWRVLDDLAIQGRNGTCVMREILMERGEGYVAPASDLEADFVGLLRRAGLPLPEREVDLGDADQWIGRVEFVYRAERVLIEVDSRLHHSALLDFEHDRERDNKFAADGYRVLRITYLMIKECPRDIERIVRRALRVAA
jgi:uncharacterized protein DUF559